MDLMHPDRRLFMTALAAMLGLPAASMAREDFIDLDWSDLIPPGQEYITQTLQGMGIIPHDEMAMLRSEQPQSSGVRTDYNGKVVRIPGYMVPLDTTGGRGHGLHSGALCRCMYPRATTAGEPAGFCDHRHALRKRGHVRGSQRHRNVRDGLDPHSARRYRVCAFGRCDRTVPALRQHVGTMLFKRNTRAEVSYDGCVLPYPCRQQSH